MVSVFRGGDMGGGRIDDAMGVDSDDPRRDIFTGSRGGDLN